MDRLVFGTPALNIDLVEATTDISGIEYESFAQVETIGNLTSFVYIPRDTEVSTKKTTTFNIVTVSFSSFLGPANGRRRPVQHIKSYDSHIW